MQAPKNDSKPRVLCPIGLHLCRLVQVVDLGNQRFQGKDPSRKIYFGFETLEQLHVFKEENGPEPFMLQAEFAFFMTSSNKKTKLRQFVEGWFDKAFASEDEAAAFDFSKLLGRLAGVMVAHGTKTDGSKKTYIAAVCPPDGEKKKLQWPAYNKQVCYEITDEEGGGFKLLPPFLQSKIRESEEFKGTQEHPEADGDYGNPAEGYQPRPEGLPGEQEQEDENSIPF